MHVIISCALLSKFPIYIKFETKQSEALHSIEMDVFGRTALPKIDGEPSTMTFYEQHQIEFRKSAWT